MPGRMAVLLAGLMVVLAGGWVSAAQEPPGSSNAVARVNGEEISEQDLLSLIQPQIQQLRNQELELKKRALETLVDQFVLGAEAREKGIPVEQLLADVDEQVPDATEEEISAFYEGQKERIGRPLEEVSEQIRQVIHQSKTQQYRQEYTKRLRADVKVEMLLPQPRMEVAIDPSRVIGPEDAPVTIVEFSDFQCPFCQRAYPVVKQIMEKYDGLVRLSYRDFPLSQMHGQAQSAAQAAQCAGEQGKFWEFHDLLFENFNQLSMGSFIEHAMILEMGLGEFQQCMESGKFLAVVEKDFQDGRMAGINGTPAFFINGIVLTGAQPASAFEAIIESELSAAGVERGAPAE